MVLAVLGAAKEEDTKKKNRRNGRLSGMQRTSLAGDV
jgi:hypothetical protein